MSKSTSRTPVPGKATKIQLRLRSSEKALIVRAAQLRHTTVTKFMLENACQAAQQVLADQVHFVLPQDGWRAFCKALDAPPRDIPALRRLLLEDGVFDGERSSRP
jgi:uncharacterized protein (DUF1778 family)